MVRDLPTEQAVRSVVAELDLRIVNWLRAPSGPQVQLNTVHAENVMERWRADRQAAARGLLRPCRATRQRRTRSHTTQRWRRIARRRREISSVDR
jgi:hypothetical protein